MSRNVRVLFEQVGRGKKSWSVDAGDVRLDDDGLPSEVWLAEQIRKSKALASRGVDVMAGLTPGRFVILVGGFRPVGTGRVEVQEQ